MSDADGGDALLASEHAEPGVSADAALDALADEATMVVAVRSDGKAAIRRGLPAGIDTAGLSAPVLAGTAVAIVLDMGADTEAIALFGRFQDPRAALVGTEDPAAVLGALGFGQWRVRHRFCSRCGAPLEPRADGRVLRCTAEGSEQFPRLEPAVIMRVVDVDDRILLGRQPMWPPGRFSVLAGFVDPGESLEAAVVREIMEEVGVPVRDVAYHSSQPWPFPASLMLGFTATATSTDLVLEDEIAEALWFSREELAEAMDRGQAFVPPDVSIAHHLLVDWLGADVPLATWYDQR